MIIGSIFGIAFDAIRANKLRSSLTLVGIIFGVTSVMTIISALQGMMDSIEEEISVLGPSTFMVSRMMMAMSDEEFREKIKRRPIQLEAAEMIAENCTQCERVSPRVFASTRVKYRDKALRDVTVMGGTADFIHIVDMEVELGRFHSYEDDLYRRRVVFAGAQIVEEFFPDVDPLGKEIKLGGVKYTIIGVAKKKGEMFGESQDDFVVIPLSAHIRQWGQPRRGVYLTIKAYSVDVLEDCMDEVRVILRSKRNVPYNEPDDFDMMTAESALDMINQFTRITRFALVGISAISLVIGGIVVMNIMMVAVTERTREIGIRKSIGAKFKHILWQFLFEAVIITFAGGLIGIVLGFVIAKTLVSLIGMSISPSAAAIILGLSISGGIGLIFGVVPALKAARMDPVKALSYE
ncbi:MAG: ABC transporter permease [candidate division Zixibacteria bacterium]|nr:ABC transporter permease [candidate division Zixibacteria bacterium]